MKRRRLPARLAGVAGITTIALCPTLLFLLSGGSGTGPSLRGNTAARRSPAPFTKDWRIACQQWPTHAGPGPHPACGSELSNATFNVLFGGIKWSSSPVTYRIDSAAGEFETAADNAAQTWQAASGGITFQKVTTGENVLVRFAPIDGVSGTVAETHLFLDPSIKTIFRAEVTFDNAEAWGDLAADQCPTPTGGTAFDRQNVATHEWGHVGGLAHVNAPKDGALTMYRFTQFGETFRRSLGLGDMLGLQFLYGI